MTSDLIGELYKEGLIDDAVQMFKELNQSSAWMQIHRGCMGRSRWAGTAFEQVFTDYLNMLDDNVHLDLEPGTEVFDQLPEPVKEAIQSYQDQANINEKAKSIEDKMITPETGTEVGSEWVPGAEWVERRVLTELRAEIDRLKAKIKQLLIDPLTQIPVYVMEDNRALMDQRPYKLAVDVSGLKFLNDNFGEESGNTLLATFAQVAKQQNYDIQRIVMGGDEFVLGFDTEADAIQAGTTLKEAFGKSIIVTEDENGNYNFYWGFQIYTGVGETYTQAYDKGVNADKREFKRKYPEVLRGAQPPSVQWFGPFTQGVEGSRSSLAGRPGLPANAGISRAFSEEPAGPGPAGPGAGPETPGLQGPVSPGERQPGPGPIPQPAGAAPQPAGAAPQPGAAGNLPGINAPDLQGLRISLYDRILNHVEQRKIAKMKGRQYNKTIPVDGYATKYKVPDSVVDLVIERAVNSLEGGVAREEVFRSMEGWINELMSQPPAPGAAPQPGVGPEGQVDMFGALETTPLGSGVAQPAQEDVFTPTEKVRPTLLPGFADAHAPKAKPKRGGALDTSDLPMFEKPPAEGVGVPTIKPDRGTLAVGTEITYKDQALQGR